MYSLGIVCVKTWFISRGAFLVGANKLATGHNADDVAETVLLNMLRGDIARLQRSSSSISGFW